MLNKIVLVVVLLLMMICQGTATIHVNEVVGEFRISFDVGDNTSAIIKAWNLQNNSEFQRMSDTLGAAEILGVGTLNTFYVPTDFSAVGVLILNKSVNTTDFETEFFNKNISRSYVRVYDRTIDGHKGFYALSGDGPEDSDMERFGLYWLNEADDGMATELVLIVNSPPSSSLGVHGSESIMTTLLNTVHVEKI